MLGRHVCFHYTNETGRGSAHKPLSFFKLLGNPLGKTFKIIGSARHLWFFRKKPLRITPSNLENRPFTSGLKPQSLSNKNFRKNSFLFLLYIYYIKIFCKNQTFFILLDSIYTNIYEIL